MEKIVCHHPEEHWDGEYGPNDHAMGQVGDLGSSFSRLGILTGFAGFILTLYEVVTSPITLFADCAGNRNWSSG